jgi:hypothetical protein
MNQLSTTVFAFALTLFSIAVYGQDTSNCLDESCLETLHFDSVRLNSKIPLMLKDVDLIGFLGQPDSVVAENDWECGNYINGDTSVRILYYGKTKFMSSRGVSLLYVLNLEDNRFTFDFGGKQVKKGTSKADLKGLFPHALNALNKGLQSYNREGQMKVRMVQTPDFGDSSGWMFTFSNQMIKEIELWWFIC